MASNKLIIVESPGKCKKIEKLLGINCKASCGHIMDIPHNLKWFEHSNICPPYEVTKDKLKVVNNLKKCIGPKSNKCEVLIASDMDREGEAIAENLMRVLNLDKKLTKRIRFNQITKKALEEAIENPGILNVNLFHAQQARRILDILYGFMVSPILWSHIQRGLSAGRCQSPTVKLCLDRQEQQTIGNRFYKAKGKLNRMNLYLEINRKEKLDETIEVETWINNIKNHQTMEIVKIKESIRKNNPSPPCTTSSLQQEVYKKFGINPENCMKIAQKLYEQGYITYMRTDSTELSEDFRTQAMNYITENYGKSYHKWNIFGSKTNNIEKKVKTQEAHEAIRPLRLDKIPLNLQINEIKVFTVIWLRAVGSQMTASEYNELILTFSPNKKEVWESIFKKLKFKGHMILRSPFEIEQAEVKENDNTELPQVKVGDNFNIIEILTKECVEIPPSPYTPADLIKTLEKTGIGRPSTFSTILNKIQQRGYVHLDQNIVLDKELKQYSWKLGGRLCIGKYTQKIGGQKNVFVVTPLGIQVTEFLQNNCSAIIRHDFTSNLENSLDMIARGSISWTKFISDFYLELKTIVSHINPPTFLSEPKSIHWIKVFPELFNNMSIGFINTKNGITLVSVLNNTITKYASLPPKTSKIEQVNFDEATHILSLPKKMGIYDKKDVYLHLGRFGWYVKIDNINIKINNERKAPVWIDIINTLDVSKDKKNKKLIQINETWSIWYCPKNKNHFLMKKQKKVNFYKLPNYNPEKKYTVKMCEEIAKALSVNN